MLNAIVRVAPHTQWWRLIPFPRHSKYRYFFQVTANNCLYNQQPHFCCVIAAAVLGYLVKCQRVFVSLVFTVARYFEFQVKILAGREAATLCAAHRGTIGLLLLLLLFFLQIVHSPAFQKFFSDEIYKYFWWHLLFPLLALSTPTPLSDRLHRMPFNSPQTLGDPEL